MSNTAKFEKLAQLMAIDKNIDYDEAYTRVKNAFDNFEDILGEFNKRLEQIVRGSGGANLLTKDGEKIDSIQLIHAHGLYGIELGSNDEIIQIIELEQCMATGRVYASCEEYEDSIELNFEFVGTKEACLKYLHDEEENNAEH